MLVDMRKPFVVAAAFVLMSLGSSACSRVPDRRPTLTAEVVKEIEAWRTKHEVDYRRDWVTIAGLHDLKAGPNTAGSGAGNDIQLPASVPATLGRFVLDGERVRFEPAKNAGVMLKDKPVTAPIELKDDGGSGADELLVGECPARRARERRAPVDSRARSERRARARLPRLHVVPDRRAVPRHRTLHQGCRSRKSSRCRIRSATSTAYSTEGVVEFTLLGQTLRLRPFTTRPKRFYFVFRDASSGQETYEAARFVYSNLLDDGTTVIDFNQAYNPPCAFNPYTTCPIPLKENRLPVKILAGEKAYPVHVPLPQRPSGGGDGTMSSRLASDGRVLLIERATACGSQSRRRRRSARTPISSRSSRSGAPSSRRRSWTACPTTAPRRWPRSTASSRPTSDRLAAIDPSAGRFRSRSTTTSCAPR